jgi:hypothetical protein
MSSGCNVWCTRPVRIGQNRITYKISVGNPKERNDMWQLGLYGKNALTCNLGEKERVDRDSVVGTETRYGLGGTRIESWWGWDVPHPTRQWVPGLSRGKAAGAWHWPPAPSSTDIKEYSFISGLFWGEVEAIHSAQDRAQCPTLKT